MNFTIFVQLSSIPRKAELQTKAGKRSLREANPDDETARMHEGAVYFGVGLIVLGLVATVLAGLSHWFTLRRLRLRV